MEAGHTTIESDGFTVNDLMALNSESMQKWLGFATIDQEADIHALFGMCVDKMEKSLSPPPELAEVAPVIEEDIKKPFCAHCSSKGVKHKSDCTRPL